MTSSATQNTNDLSKTDRVYETLRKRIRELQLPPGSRLQKNELAVEFGVSRAPVSEAIARLAEEGLVEVFPQSGSFVTPIRIEDIHESLLIRTGLEVEAVRRVTQQADQSLINALEQNLLEQEAALDTNNMEALDQLDAAFHAKILETIKSPRVQRLLDESRALLDRPRFHALPEGGRSRETVAEHRRIVDAIRTQDVEFAGAAMRVHIAMVAGAIDKTIMSLERENE